MAYELYVLNQRLPRFPLKVGYSDVPMMEAKVSKTFASWLNETMIGNLQRRRACSQAFDFAVWMEQNDRVLESVQPHEFNRFITESNSPERCKIGEFLQVARVRIPDLKWDLEIGAANFNGKRV